MSETALTRADHGKTVAATVGSTLSVGLDESPTTGYTWANRSAGDVLSLDGSDFALASGAAVGGGGRRSLRFSVVAAGTVTLRLLLLRGWEADSCAVDEFAVLVVATPP